MRHSSLLVLTAIITIFSACGRPGSASDTDEQPLTLFPKGAYPSVASHNGTYYYTMQLDEPGIVVLYSAPTLPDIAKAERKIIWRTDSMHNFWSPEIHRINDRWFIYFEADNGKNTDNHQIYVLENDSENPMEGQWKLRGPVLTNSDWNFGIHPSVITVNGRQYMLWSGWQRRRTETETQCIFIAEMENPWTLKSQRVLLSTPEYEWERQWINPDGSRSAYPIFVNENPEAFLSPDGKYVIVTYSASGIWTTYNSLGMLYASTSSDLLDPRSWTKVSEPQFLAAADSELFGASNISVIHTDNPAESYMLYQVKTMRDRMQYSQVRMKKITWDENSLPVFGAP